MSEQSGWSAYEKLVLSRLDTLDSRMTNVEAGLVLVRIDIAQLKVKAGIWGAAAGMVPALLTAITAFIAGAPGL
jgi:hypothetical protein